MKAGFAEIAEALRDIARWERSRIQLIQDLAMVGRVRDASDMELGGWKARAERLTQAAEVFTVLVDHETAVRSLDPLLAR